MKYCRVELIHVISKQKLRLLPSVGCDVTFSVVVYVAACDDVSVIGLVDAAGEVDVTVCDEGSVFGSVDVTGADVTISDEVSVTVSVAGHGVSVTVSVATEVVDCSVIVTPLSEHYRYISTSKVIIQY